MKILVIGATGMVGHILFHELQNKNINVVGIDRKKKLKDILYFDLYTEIDTVIHFIKNENFDIIINCSAILINESNINRKQAVYINSFFPHLLVDLFKSTNTKIIHLSTGGVFTSDEKPYFEDSPISPPTYYGITKAAGEFNNEKDLIIRNDFWGPDANKDGTGLFNWFFNQQGMVTAYTNTFFNGISNIEFARILLELISYNGILHIGANENISKCNFLEKIKSVFDLSNTTLLYNNNDFKNIFLKSNYKLPHINNYDIMIKDVYEYLINNKQNYIDIYPQIDKN